MPAGYDVPYLPDAINQFNRLIDIKQPTAYNTGAAWNNVRYINGHYIDFDPLNCMASMGAVAIDAATGGRTKTSPNSIRNHQNDYSGGIGIEDVNVAWHNLGYGKQLIMPYGADWSDVMLWLRQGRFVIFAVDYGYVPYEYKEQKDGNFDHALGACDVRASDGAFMRYDSLGKGAKRLPQRSVRVAAEAYAMQKRGSRSRLLVGYTNVIPAPISAAGTTLRYGGQPVARGRYIARRVPLIPVRSAPNQDASVRTRLEPGKGDFAAGQTTTKGQHIWGSSTWKGTADGRSWVHESLVQFAGPRTGKEDVR